MSLGKRNSTILCLAIAIVTIMFWRISGAASQKRSMESTQFDVSDKQESGEKLALLAAPNIASLQSSNISIDEFQVTQGIQASGEDSHRVPLVRDGDGHFKRIVVRVAAHSTSTESISVTVFAHLMLDNGFQQITYAFPSLPSVLVTQTLDLTSEDVITIPIQLSSLMTDTILMTATVKISSTALSPQLLETSDPITYEIRGMQTPQIFYYPLRFPDEIQPVTSTIASMSAAGFVKGTSPVADSIDFYRSVPYNTLHYPIIEVFPDHQISDLPGQSDPDSALDIASEACVVLHHLASLRNGLATCGYGPDPYTFVYGWVNDDPNADVSVIVDNGYASQSGRVGFGNTLAKRGQRTFAHELTHMVGMIHKDAGLNDIENQLVGWDNNWLLNSSDIWAANQVTSSLKSVELYDVRVAGRNTNEAWIERDTYSDLLARLDDPLLLPQSSCLDDSIKSLFSVATTFSSQLDLGQISNGLLGEFTSNNHALDASNPITVVIIQVTQSWLIDDLHNVYLIRNTGQQLQIYHVTEARATVGSQYCVVPDADSASGYVAIPFPTFIWPWSLQPTPIEDAAKDLFTLTIDLTSGAESSETLTTTFDPRIGADPNKPERDILYGFFSAAMPYSETRRAITITKVSITAANGLPVPILDRVTSRYSDELINRFINQPFTIDITNPSRPDGVNAGTEVIIITEQGFNIQWDVIDASGRNLNLFEYQVLYSHDGGRIWTPLAVNLPGVIQGITISRAELCTTRDNVAEGPVGIIRVLGSDGLNTARDDVYVSFNGDPTPSIYCERGTNRAPTRKITPDLQLVG